MENGKDPAKESQKEAQKQFESYYTVAKHKLGREPTFEEVVGMMGENSQKNQTESVPTPVASQSQPADDLEKDALGGGDDVPEEGDKVPPRILGMKVYFGMGPAQDGSDQRKPDPNKILFYEDPSSGACYDCSQDEWSEQRPPVLDHLPSRPIEHTERDIVSAIAHGVMDDEGYEALDKAGMITDTPKALWEKTKKLQKDLEVLEQMEAMEKSDEIEGQPLDSDYAPEGHVETRGPDNVDSILQTAGVDRSVFNDLAEVHGDDVAAQIMATAMQLAITNMEDQIRKIVRDELTSLQQEYGYEDEEEEESTPVGALDDDAVFTDDEGIS